jgi:SpoIID/LytB domain protein
MTGAPVKRLAAAALAALAMGLGPIPVGAEVAPAQVRVGLAWHRTTVVVGAPGPFVLSAGGEETKGERDTWSVYLRSAAPPSARAGERPAAGEVYVVGARGPGRWLGLPLRLRPGEESADGLLAGPDDKSLRRYAGELEVAGDAAGMLSLVNAVDLETYARGVVCAEMGPSYPLEALKAQAVAARSEAMFKLGRHRADGFDLCAEGHCQAYRGISGQAPAGDAAVAATRGEILTYDGRPADAVYHAVCGGHTESARDVWGSDVPYLQGVADGDRDDRGYREQDDRLRAYLKTFPAVNCRQPEYVDLSRFRWVRTLPREEIDKSLADMVSVGEVVDLRPLERGASGRIARLEVVGTLATTTLSRELVIRRALGDLPSSAFMVERLADAAGRAVAFVLWGAGWGHGVGMCQVGAAGMAAAGRDYREILAKYYQGAKIQTLY